MDMFVSLSFSLCERERETEREREKNLLASAMKRPAPELGCRAT